MSVENNGYMVKYAQVDPHRISNHLEPEQDEKDKLEKTLGFYSKLKTSIKQEGFRNPLLIVALREEDIRIRYGGSRLSVAQELDISVPCIITDFKNVFPDAEVLFTLQDIRAKFLDQPKKVFFQPQGLWISGCEHYHLKPEPSRRRKVLNKMKKPVKIMYLKN